MEENSTVIRLRQPDDVDDPLTSILRSGARQLLVQAIEMEAEAFLAAMKDRKLPDGRDRVVRHGHGPERTIQTGIGPVPVSRVNPSYSGPPDFRSGHHNRGESAAAVWPSGLSALIFGLVI